jgi:tetratricopeptide (TPR) repeat protein
MDNFAVAHLEEIDELADGRYLYRPVRHHLDITAFGASVWSARAAGDEIIAALGADSPEADQELFLVVRGHAVFELNGDQVDAPTGTLVYAPPRAHRKAIAKEAGTLILLVEGTPGQGYEARGWELWAPLTRLYSAGEYAEVATRLREAVEASPQYALLFFNLACCESLIGQTSDALDHLRHAIDMSEEFRAFAKDDPDLDPLRNEPAFKELISNQPPR